MSSCCFEVFSQLELGTVRDWTLLAPVILIDEHAEHLVQEGILIFAIALRSLLWDAIPGLRLIKLYLNANNPLHCQWRLAVVAMLFYSWYVLLLFLWSLTLPASYKCFDEVCECSKASLLTTAILFSVFFFWYSTFCFASSVWQNRRHNNLCPSV